MTAAIIPAAVALPLIQNRAERLAAHMRTTRLDPLDPARLIREGIESIAADLADVVAQFAEATS